MKILIPSFFCQNLRQNLTKFDTVKYCQRWEKPNVRDKTFIFYAWHLLGGICLERWISGPLIQVILEIDIEIDSTDPATEERIRATIYTSRLRVWLHSYRFLTGL